MSKRSVYDWQRAVFRSPISANVRLLLMYLSEHMREHDKHVSVPRKKIATALGWSETRVSERITEAVKHDFLTPVSAGHKGHTAVYAGTFPDHTTAVSVRKTRTLSRDQTYGRFTPPKRPEVTDTSSRAEPPTGPPSVDERRQDEEAARDVASRPATGAGCRLHSWADCPDHRCAADGRRAS